jgi:hypothetical protein
MKIDTASSKSGLYDKNSFKYTIFLKSTSIKHKIFIEHILHFSSFDLGPPTNVNFKKNFNKKPFI